MPPKAKHAQQHNKGRQQVQQAPPANLVRDLVANLLGQAEAKILRAPAKPIAGDARNKTIEALETVFRAALKDPRSADQQRHAILLAMNLQQHSGYEATASKKIVSIFFAIIFDELHRHWADYGIQQADVHADWVRPDDFAGLPEAQRPFVVEDITQQEFESFEKGFKFLVSTMALTFGDDLTGLKIWNGAHVLAKYLSDNRRELDGRSILELGSGVGLSGILASHFGGNPIVLTDGVDETLELLRENVELNSLTEKVHVQKLFWGIDNAKTKEKYGTFDLILGGDVLYAEEATEPILLTVNDLMKEDGEFVMIYVERGHRILGTSLIKRATDHYHLRCESTLLAGTDPTEPPTWLYRFRRQPQ